VEPGAKVEATIRLLNPLDRPVEIKLSRPSCTCTTVDMVGKIIPARGTLEMPMAMQTSRSVGNRSAMVTLVFDGIQAPLSVRIDAETAYAVRANPAFIDALAPERMKGFFELVASDGTPFRVLTVDGKPALGPEGAAVGPAARQVVRYDLTAPGRRPAVRDRRDRPPEVPDPRPPGPPRVDPDHSRDRARRVPEQRRRGTGEGDLGVRDRAEAHGCGAGRPRDLEPRGVEGGARRAEGRRRFGPPEGPAHRSRRDARTVPLHGEPRHGSGLQRARDGARLRARERASGRLPHRPKARRRRISWCRARPCMACPAS
ncbi:MAG: DUF1573 domain-containing protein, partial [Actinobacteria bacterium]|nr:DUF1573 domain-containing protein [Actinomycetota bacterium]